MVCGDSKLEEIELATSSNTEVLADTKVTNPTDERIVDVKQEDPIDLNNINLENPIEQSIDVSSVNENSIIPDTYTDLSYNQRLGYGSSNSKLQVRSAKRSS